MTLFGYGGGVSIWQNKNPTAGLAVGFVKFFLQRIRTRLPRGPAAARCLAADSDSNYDSRGQAKGSRGCGQFEIWWSVCSRRVCGVKESKQ
jgi:hypothetical protein